MIAKMCRICGALPETIAKEWFIITFPGTLMWQKLLIFSDIFMQIVLKKKKSSMLYTIPSMLMKLIRDYDKALKESWLHEHRKGGAGGLCPPGFLILIFSC